LQIIKIGDLVLTGIPGEITTMAGRRLKKTVLNEFKDLGIKHLALAAYANDYSLYITTKEEYDKQHYEGGCTLFGPYTLMAYQQEFRKLANALKKGKLVDPGPSPSKKSTPNARRITIRNLSTSSVTAEFFNQSDPTPGGLLDSVAVPLPDGELQIAKYSDHVFLIPSDVNAVKMRINKDKSRIVQNIAIHQLVTICKNGKVSVSSYLPPHA
jgi:neutral ceramidase